MGQPGGDGQAMLRGIVEHNADGTRQVAEMAHGDIDGLDPIPGPQDSARVRPSEVSGRQSPRAGPGSSCAPKSRDLAQPMVGMPSHKPTWLARPIPRG